MAADNNLRFIRKKILLLRSAMMYVSGSELVKLENNIATALRIDDEGNLWFVTDNPPYPVEECEQFFPARLCFYRKGFDFSVEVSGKATIVEDYCGDDGEHQSDNARKILVKLNMINIEYVEPHARKSKSGIELMLEEWYHWFLRKVSVPHESGSILKKLRQTH